MTIWLVWRNDGHRQALIDLFTTELVARECVAVLNRMYKVSDYYYTSKVVHEIYLGAYNV